MNPSSKTKQPSGIKIRTASIYLAVAALIALKPQFIMAPIDLFLNAFLAIGIPIHNTLSVFGYGPTMLSSGYKLQIVSLGVIASLLLYALIAKLNSKLR
jgi:hypothetical protein